MQEERALTPSQRKAIEKLRRAKEVIRVRARSGAACWYADDHRIVPRLGRELVARVHLVFEGNKSPRVEIWQFNEKGKF